jgi:predicted kinase
MGEVTPALGPCRLLVLVTGLQGTGKSTVADAAGAHLGAAVLAHDWAMSGLRPYPELQRALDAIDFGHRHVGWSILCALARSELRRGHDVVVDGVARAPEIARCRDLAAEERARLVLVVTECPDVAVHQSRVTARARAIPDWYELDWDHVQRARDAWMPVRDPDLVLNAATSLSHNLNLLRSLLDRERSN